MGSVTKCHEGRITREGDRRVVVIPEEFFLEGEKVLLIQDRDGVISIHPAEEAARRAMWARFNPFIEWENETWPKETPVWDDEQLAWVVPSQE